MKPMVVTLEVSQLEMSPLKFRMSLKSPFMSVIAETSQSAMGPYFLMAAVGSALYARSAACSSALIVKANGKGQGSEGQSQPTPGP